VFSRALLPSFSASDTERVIEAPPLVENGARYEFPEVTAPSVWLPLSVLLIMRTAGIFTPPAIAQDFEDSVLREDAEEIVKDELELLVNDCVTEETNLRSPGGRFANRSSFVTG